MERPGLKLVLLSARSILQPARLFLQPARLFLQPARLFLLPAAWAVILSLLGCRAADSAGWQVAGGDGLGESIDALFQGFEEPGSPGGIVAVVKDGVVLHLKGYGSANREFAVPWTPDTRYRIASISKGVTGYAALKLQDRGLVDLHDPVGAYLSDFPPLDPQPTLRQLLTMTSGLWYDEWLLPLADVRGYATLDEMYGLVRRQDRLNYRPGTAYDYVDTNYRVFARVVATVMAMPFHEAMDALVYEPLGMTSTLNPPDLRQMFDGQGSTYMAWDDEAIPYRFEFPFETSGDGSLITTLHDLLSWIEALDADDGSGSTMLDRMARLDTLESGHVNPYGLGIGRIRHRGLDGWGHGGATGTRWATFPDQGLTIALFTNYLGGISPEAVLTGVMDAVLSTGAVEVGAEGPAYLATRPIAGDERPSLEGLFLHRPSGFFLESFAAGPGVGHSFAGTSLFLEPTGGCRFRTAPFVHWPLLEVEPTECGSAESDLMVRHADWDAPRRFDRVDAVGPAGPVPDDLLGGYVSEQLGTRWRVVFEGGEAGIRIGAGVVSGQRLVLHLVAPDRFIARPGPAPGIDLLALPSMGVSFQRGSDGTVERMVVNSNRIRGLVFRPEGR